MNKVLMTGNICKDIEMRTTQSNVACATFSIAVPRKFKVNGEKVSDFFNVVAWRTTAEFCGKYFRKGMKIAVVGELQTRSYDNKDGKKVYVTEIIADEVEACERINKEQNITDNSGDNQFEDDTDTKLPFDL